MKSILIIIVAALAVPVAAQAKEITGLAVCGPDECDDAVVTVFGHSAPFDESSQGESAPAPTSYYRIRFVIDGRYDSASVFYEPRSGLVAYQRNLGSTATWTRLHPTVAAAVKEAAKSMRPFPPPSVSHVRIGRRVLHDGAATYLGLLTAKGAYAVPGGGPGLRIRLSSTVESPWTLGSLLYYPEDGVLALAGGRFMKLPADLAADLEAGRPLGAGGGSIAIPWLALGVLLAGLVVLLAIRLRRAPRPVAEPEATPAR